ncbi:hypothetical protein, partial [Cerasicoccus arenae]
MKNQLRYLLFVLPCLAQAQSFHHLYTLEAWDYDEIDTSRVTNTTMTPDGGAALLFSQDQGEFWGYTFLQFGELGGVAENISLNGMFTDEGPEIKVSGGDVYLDYVGEETVIGLNSAMRVFCYEIDDGLNRIYDAEVILTNRLVSEMYLDADGFRFSSSDTQNGDTWASRVLATGEAEWTYAVDFAFQSFVPQVSFSDDQTLFWTIDDGFDGFPMTFTAIDQAGDRVWRKRLTSSNLANSSLDLGAPSLNACRIELFDDETSLMILDLFDDDTFEIYTLFIHLDDSGSVIWTVSLPFEVEAPNFFSPED